MTDYPEGYLSVTLAKPQLRKALRHLGGGWRDPIHGTWVYAAEDGMPLATVRTLGILRSKKDRRYALKVQGVMFIRMQPLVSRTRPVNTDLAGYNTAKAALAAGEALIAQLRQSEPEGIAP